MDFLKYLDVIIGLAVVMVLLSPLVTFVTHAYLWLTNSRSTFLEQALQRLILQLEGHPATIVSVRDASGQPVPDAVIATAKGLRLAKSGPTGDAWFPAGLPNGSISKGNVKLKVTGAPAGSTVSVRRIPQASREPQTSTSRPADAAGETTLTYVFEGPGHYSSRAATLIVKDANKQQVAAEVTCSLGGASATLIVPQSGRSEPLARPPGAAPAPAGQTPVLPPQLPATSEIEFVVKRSDGTTPEGLVIEAEFERNDSFDRILGPRPIDDRGMVSIETSAMTIADAVVRHPMVSRVPPKRAWLKVPPVKNPKAEVVEREELIRIVLELAAGDGDGRTQLTDDARQSLKRLLALNEVPNAADTLAAIRKESQALEDTHPHLALHVRHAQAIARAAKNAFVGKINFWFDAAMARATQQYTARARAATVAAALMVAAVLQFDSFDLLQRLSTDDTFRSSLVEMARIEQQRIDTLQSTPGANQDELELHKARRQEIDANLAALRAPELAILPDHLIWQAVPRARLIRDPLWQGPYPARLQLVTGGKTWDVQPSWRNDYMHDIHAAIETSGAPVHGAMRSGDEYLVLKAETPFVARIFVSDPSPSDRSQPRLRELAAEGLGAVVETEFRMTSEWPQDGSALGPLQLIIDSTPTPVPMMQDEKPLTVVRARLVDDLRERLARAAPALRFRVRCERSGRAAECPDGPGAAADFERVLVVTARNPEIRDIRLLSDPANPYSNRLRTLQRRPLAWRVRASELPAASAGTLRVYTYQSEADAPASLAEEQRFVSVQLGAGQASPNGSPAPAARTPETANVAATATDTPPTAASALDDRAAQTGDRIVFVELPRIAPARDGRTPTPAERAAAALREQLRAPLVAGNQAATMWPPTLTADSYTNDELVLTSDRLGALELRYMPGKPETNVLSRPVERVRPLLERLRPASAAGAVDAAGNAFGPGVFGVLLSWALLSLGAPFWFDTLKNALKLRPSAAVTEERNSRQRQSHNPPPPSQPGQ